MYLHTTGIRVTESCQAHKQQHSFEIRWQLATHETLALCTQPRLSLKKPNNTDVPIINNKGPRSLKSRLLMSTTLHFKS